MRRRPAPAAAGDLALGEAELRGQHVHRAGLDRPVHRGQLGPDPIGGGSADASAGTLDNAFDFNQSYGHAPAIILNDTTGEIEKTIYPDGSSSGPGGNGGSGGNGGNGGNGGSGGNGQNGWQGNSSSSSSTGAKIGGLGSIKLPHVTWSYVTGARAITLTVKTSGGSNAATLIRARLLRGRSLVANRAGLVRKHQVKLTLSLARKARTGRYTLRLTVDTAGRVTASTHNLSVR